MGTVHLSIVSQFATHLQLRSVVAVAAAAAGLVSLAAVSQQQCCQAYQVDPAPVDCAPPGWVSQVAVMVSVDVVVLADVLDQVWLAATVPGAWAS